MYRSNGIGFLDLMPPRVACGSLAGEVLPGWQPVLFGPGGWRLDEWLREGRARLVKHGPRRAVYRIDASDGALFVKHYRYRRWWEPLANLFRHSPSRREFNRARIAIERQIPTAEPVAWLESRRAGIAADSFLITREIRGTCSLDEYLRMKWPQLAPAAAARVRRKLSLALARLIAAAHRQGIEHDDLHAGNLLVRLETCQADAADECLPEMFLIDLPGVRVTRALNWRRTRASLTMLAAACSTFASTAEVCRFLRAYFAERTDLRQAGLFIGPRKTRRVSEGWRAMAAQIARAIPARKRRVARSRDKRSMRSNRDFYRRANGRATALAVADLPAARLTSLIDAPPALLMENVNRPWKLSHRSMVVQAELTLERGTTPVAYKRVRPRNWWKTLLHYFRRSPAVTAWYYGHALLLRGVATARPLAVIEQKRFGLPAEGYLATEWIAGAKNLHVYGWHLGTRHAAERRRRTRQLCDSLGRLLGRMHAWHVSHRDLKGCNILIVERDTAVDCFLIDADSVALPYRLLPYFRAFNLGRLAASIEAHTWVTRADRLRFFRAYLAELHRGDPAAWPSDWKQGWRAVAKATRSILGRLRRNGREIV